MTTTERCVADSQHGIRRHPCSKKSPRSKDPTRTPFDMVTFMDYVLDDSRRYVPEDTYLKLKYCLKVAPDTFRSVVTEETLKAESNLALGGFERYAVLRQVQSLVKKNSDWYASTEAERQEKAITKFLEAEKACGETNSRLARARIDPGDNKVACQVLNLAKCKVRNVLGRLTESKYLDALSKADFGPGSPYLSTISWEDNRSMYYKMSGDQTVTAPALEHAVLALELNDGWKDLLVGLGASYMVVDEGEILSVDKNAEINRVIEKQPSLNVWLQKGAGTLMADLLKGIGIDLSTQARNHRGARLGSLNGKTATVDMTSASDLNACALVEWLFPPDWYQFLDDLTVRWGKLPNGTIVRHEMFSSMGNATTFAIECLVFYAIAWASSVLAGEDIRDIRVYGDDVIVPIGSVALMFETLRFAGHQPNVEKTHVWGPFRESCGRDYVYGLDVRPVYLDHVPCTDMEVMSLYNRLTLMAIAPYPRTTKYLRHLGKDLVGPPDLGASLDYAFDALAGSNKRVRMGRPRGSAEARVLALAVDSYYVEDPPPASGFCTSNQSQYWTFRGYTQRAAALDAADDVEVKWRAVLYGVQLLGGEVRKLPSGATLQPLSRRGPIDIVMSKVPSQRSKTFIPEKFTFWWSRVDQVRAFLWTRRLS